MSTRAQILAEIAAQFPDNTTGLITPAKLRQVVEDVTNSCLVSETDAGTAGIAVLQAETQAEAREAIGAPDTGEITILSGQTGASKRPQVGTYLSALGDSITLATNGACTSSAYGYAELLAAATGRTLWNKGVSGAEIGDLYTQVAGTSDNNKSTRIVLIGANDSSKRTVAILPYFKAGLLASLCRLSVPYARVVGRGSLTFSAGWTDSGNYFNACKKSPGAGGTASATVVGTTVYAILATVPATTDATPQVVQITVDGVEKYNGALPQPVTTMVGLTYGAVAVRIPDLAAGSHSVVVTHVSGSVNLFMISLSGNGQAGDEYPTVVGVATLPNSGFSSASISFGAACIEVYRQLQRDGLGIKYVDLLGVWSAADHYDALHPNNQGQRKIADAVGAALGLTPPRSYPTASTGLPVNSVWCDAANGNVLKVVL